MRSEPGGLLGYGRLSDRWDKWVISLTNKKTVNAKGLSVSEPQRGLFVRMLMSVRMAGPGQLVCHIVERIPTV